jgi:uncharacterized C2H2 Zn-finger protein
MSTNCPCNLTWFCCCICSRYLVNCCCLHTMAYPPPAVCQCSVKPFQGISLGYASHTSYSTASAQADNNGTAGKQAVPDLASIGSSRGSSPSSSNSAHAGGPTAQAQAVAQRIRCKECSRVFGSYKALQQHMAGAHRGFLTTQANPPSAGLLMRCSKCAKAFQTETALAQHMQASHPDVQLDQLLEKQGQQTAVTSTSSSSKREEVSTTATDSVNGSQGGAEVLEGAQVRESSSIHAAGISCQSPESGPITCAGEPTSSNKAEPDTPHLASITPPLQGAGQSVMGDLLSLFASKEAAQEWSATSPSSQPSTAPTAAGSSLSSPGARPPRPAAKQEGQKPTSAKAAEPLPQRPSWDELQQHAAKVMQAQLQPTSTPDLWQQLTLPEQQVLTNQPAASSGPGEPAGPEIDGQPNHLAPGQHRPGCEMTQEQLTACRAALSVWAAEVRPDPAGLWMSSIDPRVRAGGGCGG